MQKITYIKRSAKYKTYKSSSQLLHMFETLKTRKKIGIFLSLIGLSFLAIPIYARFSNADTLQNVNQLSPISLTSLYTQVSEANTKIDAQQPLSTYIKPKTISQQHTDHSTFTISLPSVHMKDIKVTTNVDSNNAAVYEKVLQQSTAHFAGTALPGESGNVFIYGHSSIPVFHQLYPYSYEGIFTSLFSMQIGDQIQITYNGSSYAYVVEGISIIDPHNFQVVQNIQKTNTLTLMTCYPPGVGEKRLIVKALQI